MDMQQRDHRYIAHTYARFPLEVTGGQGSIVRGSDGREYIDLGSGIGVNLLGLNDPGWIAAITDQLHAFQHASNYYCNAPDALLAEQLCRRTGMERVFFSNSGAEANECAIKAARRWAAREKGAQYVHIVTLDMSFHGRTLATLAATGQDAYHRDYQPLPQGFLHVPVGDEAALDAALTSHPCAAILFETVQGEGGVMPIGAAYADTLRRMAQKHNVLLMADEVQCGNGRTGWLYGYMAYGLQPDVVSTAKGLGGGLPIGATLLGARVADVFEPGSHGSTFGGNPVCAAGALHVLSRLDDAMLAGVRLRSAAITERLRDAPGICSISGMGLMLGLELAQPARPFAEALLRAGVLVTTAKNKIRLLPALNIPMELLLNAVQIIRDTAAKK